MLTNKNGFKMAEITADLMIGKTLYAKQSVKLYSGNLITVIGTVSPGGVVGVVYSYVVRNGKLYWEFKGSNGAHYYAEHNTYAYQLTPAVVTALEQYQDKIDAENEQQQIAAKGAIPYYIEKYGKVLLLTAVGIVAFREIMKKVNF